VSSTNVTFSFARASRAAPEAGVPLGYGAVAASTVVNLRVALATAALAPSLALELWPYLVPGLGVGALAFVGAVRHVHREPQAAAEPSRNPLRLAEALQMAALFQIVLIGVEVVRRFGREVGVIASGAVLGLTDMDALTLSMAQAASSGLHLDTAARAIAVGLIANTLLKMGVAVALGNTGFRRVAGVSLFLMAVATGVSLVLQR
jgi:uncharacterized membrane protein (DUF4010 family)